VKLGEVQVHKMRWSDIDEDYLTVIQNKTAKHLRICILGELSKPIEQIKNRAQVDSLGSTIIATKPYRGKNQTPQPLSKQMQFDRLQAASDIDDIGAASKLLGHTTEKITRDVYRRDGERVTPVGNEMRKRFRIFNRLLVVIN
jgi:integrase